MQALSFARGSTPLVDMNLDAPLIPNNTGLLQISSPRVILMNCMLKRAPTISPVAHPSSPPTIFESSPTVSPSGTPTEINSSSPTVSNAEPVSGSAITCDGAQVGASSESMELEFNLAAETASDSSAFYEDLQSTMIN
eukprot:scaffold112177_cov55-Attheya_sp.AAC.2